MIQFAKKIDRFAVLPKLYIRKGDSFPTIYGGIMSLAVLALVIVATANFSQSLIYKRNPNIVSSQNSFEEIPKFSLEKFKMGFFLNTNYLGKIIDPSIFEISAGIFRTNFSDEGDQKFEYIPIKMELCKIDRFKSTIDNPAIKRLRFDLNLCFSEESAQRLSIEGGWGQKLMDMIFIDFNLCVNSTENG